MALVTTIHKSDEWNESAKISANVQTFRDCALHQWMFIANIHWWRAQSWNVWTFAKFLALSFHSSLLSIPYLPLQDFRLGSGMQDLPQQNSNSSEKSSSFAALQADWHGHAIPLFLEANMLPITFLHYEFVSTLMQDINDNKAQANLLN